MARPSVNNLPKSFNLPSNLKEAIALGYEVTDEDIGEGADTCKITHGTMRMERDTIVDCVPVTQSIEVPFTARYAVGRPRFV